MRPFGGRIVSLDVRGHWNRVTVCGRDLPPPPALRRALGARTETARILPRVSLRSHRPGGGARGPWPACLAIRDRLG